MSDLNQKPVLVQTKISPSIDERLGKVCKEYGFSSRYEILQYLISAFLKYADPEIESSCAKEADKLSVELAKVFEELQNKSHRINRASPNTAKLFALVESVQFYQRSGRHGTIGVKYTFGKDGSLSKTESNSKILRSVIARLFPELYKRLSSLCLSLGGVGIDDAILYLLEETNCKLLPDSIEREINEEFNQLSAAEKQVDLTTGKPRRMQRKSIKE